MDLVAIRTGDGEEQVPLETLKQSYLIFKKFLETTTDGFIAVDRECRIIEISRSYSEWLGVPHEEATNYHIDQIVPNTGMPAIIETGRYEYDVPHFLDQGIRAGNVTVCTRCPIEVDGEVKLAICHVRYSEKSAEVYKAFERVFAELEYYREEYRKMTRGAYSFDRIIGESPQLVTVKERAKRASRLDLTVLLTGETGTGKEVFALAVHNGSTRADQPFICVNCAAIPGELLESELFGYEDGAFSGANRKGKPGKIELAHGGTLFLDEIGDMPLPMQAKILRVLQDSIVERLGSTKQRKVDIRIIAATNSDLEKKLKEGAFRSDLFFRLNVIHLSLPPLRNWPDDVLLIAKSQLDRLNQKYRTRKTLSRDAASILKNYSWPGNARELINVIEQAYGFSEGNVIESPTLPPQLFSQRSNNGHIPLPPTGGTLASRMRQVEREILLSTLERCRGNHGKAAAELGLHRATLYRKLRAASGGGGEAADEV